MSYGPAIGSAISEAAGTDVAANEWLAASRAGSETSSELSGVVASDADIAAACDGLLTRCFPAGTLVATSTGNVPIEEVRLGNEVWAFDLVASRWRLCRVLQTFVHDHEGTSAFIALANKRRSSPRPVILSGLLRGDGLANRRCPEHIVARLARRPPADGLKRATFGSATSYYCATDALFQFRRSGTSRSGARSIILPSPSLKATRSGIIMCLSTTSGFATAKIFHPDFKTLYRSNSHLAKTQPQPTTVFPGSGRLKMGARLRGD